MQAPVTHILALTNIHRRRLLPVPGQVMVRLGQTVSPAETIAQAPRPGSHLVMDIRRLLNLPPSLKLDQVLQVHTGDKVEKDMPVAEYEGVFKRIARAPEDATIVMTQGSRLVLETSTEVLQVKAGFSGEVSEIIPERGAWLETDGALIQGSWGNGNIESGLLLSRLSSPEDVLDIHQLDVSMRGGIVAAGHCSSAEALKMAGEIPLRGLILVSLTADLVPLAESLKLAILVVEGFGKIPLCPPAFKILASSDQREVCLLAHRVSGFSAERPEIIIPLNANGDIAMDVNEFKPGQTVRLNVGKYTGCTGRLSEIKPGIQTFPSGLAATAVTIQLMDGTEICVPVANLDVLE